MPENCFSRKEGFTLIETVISLVLISLLLTTALIIIKNQTIATYRVGEAAEMEDNLRIAAYWLAKDIREAERIVKTGSGIGMENAFIMKKGENEYVSYFYGTPSRPNIFYRGTGTNYNVNTHTLQPLTNEYLFGGTSKGYVRGWKIEYLRNDGKPAANPGEVVLVKFVLYGSYSGRDDPDKYKCLASSAYIRVRVSP